MMRVVLLAVLLAALPSTAPPTTPACGVERWDVKTLTDTAAASVDFTVRTAAVEELTALPVPGPLATHTPRFPGEMKTYQVSGSLVGYKLEKDSDIHIVIAGRSQTTMIVEIPHPDCIGTLKRAEITAARADFIRMFGSPMPRFTRPLSAASLTVTGVLFFDSIHGQTGVAANGVEMHPVLAVR